MPAIAGLHQASVACLAAFIEAPVLKGLHHLAHIDLSVQAAVRLAVVVGIVAVMGVGVGNFREGFLGSVARLPLVQDALCLSFRCCPGFIGNGSGAILSSGAFGHDQDVAHIHIHGILGDSLLGKGGFVGIEVGLDLRVGQLDGVHQALIVIITAVILLHEVQVSFHGSAGACVVCQILLGSLKAVGHRIFRQAGFQIVQELPLIGIHIKAGFDGLCLEGLVVVPGIQRIQQEELLPGSTVFGQIADLGIQGLGIVQSDHGCVIKAIGAGIVVAVLQEALNAQPVVDLQLAVGQLKFTCGCNDGIGSRLHFLVGCGVGALAGLVIGVAVGRDGGWNGLLGGSGCLRRFGGDGAALSLVIAQGSHQQSDDHGSHNNDSADHQGDLTGSSLLGFLHRCCFGRNRFFSRRSCFGRNLFHRRGFFLDSCFFCQFFCAVFFHILNFLISPFGIK